MKRDYTEYEKSKYDIYKLQRANTKYIHFNNFFNNVYFYPESKSISISVDDRYEEESVKNLIEDSDLLEEFNRTCNNDMNSETNVKYFEECEMWLDIFRKKYDFEVGEVAGTFTRKTGKLENLLVNIFSGANIRLNYGEGILDFIYADFNTPMKEVADNFFIQELLSTKIKEMYYKEKGEELPPERVTKISNRDEEIVQDFYDYEVTMNNIRNIAYASLYSAICPPVFITKVENQNTAFKQYCNYLLMLQNEYRELIEFCYDEDFYPEILGNLYPSERLALYGMSKKLPHTFRRKESLQLTRKHFGGEKMPYGLPVEEFVRKLQTADLTPTPEAIRFAEKFEIDPKAVMFHIQCPVFINLSYQFSTIAEILELEFTKMLEQNVRFRKCKRCGKYFIMKGNYDTNYCSQIADGETRSCQELAALDNYKKKMADNAAIPLYQKYYKRYAARVRVNQIKEPIFKKWKYEAMTKRDECTEGKITLNEFEQWLENSFPNRKKK